MLRNLFSGARMTAMSNLQYDYITEMTYKISAGELTVIFRDLSSDVFETEKVRAIKPLWCQVDQKQSVIKYTFKRGIYTEKTRSLVAVIES